MINHKVVVLQIHALPHNERRDGFRQNKHDAWNHDFGSDSSALEIILDSKNYLIRKIDWNSEIFQHDTASLTFPINKDSVVTSINKSK